MKKGNNISFYYIVFIVLIFINDKNDPQLKIINNLYLYFIIEPLLHLTLLFSFYWLYDINNIQS